MPKRILAGIGCDIDAVAHYLHTRTGKLPDMADVSRGYFGAEVGIHRLLRLFAKKNIKASWYIPGHTLESFPEDCKAIHDAGHEISLHGYTHEDPETLSAEQLEAVYIKTIDLITEFTGGIKPKGFTAPCWANHAKQIELLEKYGIEYDHSFMHKDFQPYWAKKGVDEYVSTDTSKDASHWMKPMVKAPDSKVVEIPANWTLDDWPPFQFNWRVVNSQGYVSTHAYEQTVKDMFTYCYEEYDTFIFPITVHPQVSGRPHILKMWERIIDFINEHENVEWMPFADMATEFKAGRIGKEKKQ